MFGGSRYLGFRGHSLNLAISIIAGLDFLLFGYDQGVMGGLLTLPSFVKTFPEIDTIKYSTANGYPSSVANHVSTIQGISVASYNVGCFIGSVLTIFIGDLLGRRKMIFLGSSIMVVGAALQCSAASLSHLVAGRIITGFGNGMNTSTIPTWASETSRSHKRGKMVMIEGAMITCGIAMSYWIDFGFSFLEPSTISWRFPIAFQIFLALILCAFIFELPESPRWLILKGKDDEALSVISALANLPPDDLLVTIEFAEIKDTVIEIQQTRFTDLFTMGPDRNFHRVLLGFMIQVFQQVTGINLVIYYSATIYQKYLGLSGSTARILAACNGTEYFLASWIAVYAIERFGRRPLMIIGSFGMTGVMTVLAIMNYLSESNKGGSTPGIISAVFLFLFNTFFAIGWLGIPWLYPAEITPLRIRAPANGLATSADWAFNFMVVMITPICFSSIGYKTYILFGCLNAFIIPVIYFFYPETAYRSLEEIDTIFRKTKGWFSVVSTASNEPRRYGKHGELLIDYVQSEEHAIGSQSVATDRGKPTVKAIEDVNGEPKSIDNSTDSSTRDMP